MIRVLQWNFPYLELTQSGDYAKCEVSSRSRHKKGEAPVGSLGRKGVLRISLFNSIERKEERSGPDQTMVD